MKVPPRTTLLLCILLVLSLALAITLWPKAPEQRADAAVVDAALESSRAAHASNPATPADDPPRQGRARPGAMSSGGGR